MSGVAIASIVFATVFGGSLLGALLQGLIPRKHFSSETKDTVKLAMELVATMTALVLGLLIAFTQSAYAAKKSELTQMAAKISFLDRALANYGPEAADARALVARIVERMIAKLWPAPGAEAIPDTPTGFRSQQLFDSIQQLAPRSDLQQSLKAHALTAAIDIGQTRWLLYEQSSGSSISTPLLVVVVSWLFILFLSFALFAPRNLTVLLFLMIAALCVSGGIFLIVEMDRPFNGLIKISSVPMRQTLAELGH